MGLRVLRCTYFFLELLLGASKLSSRARAFRASTPIPDDLKIVRVESDNQALVATLYISSETWETVAPEPGQELPSWDLKFEAMS